MSAPPSASAFIEAWADRLRGEIADTRAVLLAGSHARGEPETHSDIDFTVLVGDGEIEHHYRSWIEPNTDGRLVHVSVSTKELDSWITGWGQPARWSFGLRAREVTKVVWADDSVNERVAEAATSIRPAGLPELEDMVENLGKARNAHARSDSVTLRLALADMALLIPALLEPLNIYAAPRTRPEALRTALAFTAAPRLYREHMTLCLGLRGEACSDSDALDAGARLATGVLGIVEVEGERAWTAHPPDWQHLLRSGTLRRYLEQA